MVRLDYGYFSRTLTLRYVADQISATALAHAKNMLDKPRVSADFIDIRNGVIFLRESCRFKYMEVFSRSGQKGLDQTDGAAPALLETREVRKRK